MIIANLIKPLTLSAFIGAALGLTNQVNGQIFQSNTPMTVARAFHTATLLPNGRVLVAGGINPSSPPQGGGPAYLTYATTASAELYDPARGTWTPTGSMNTARGQHWATLLPNGQVLVEGGFDEYPGGQFLSSAELYNPSTGIWTPTGSMNTGRFWHTATLLVNGKVLVAGGVASVPGNYTSSAELYDPAAGTWTPTGSMTTNREDHTATLLANGQVLVAGGENSTVRLSTAELFNPATGTWTPTGSMTTNREAPISRLLPNGLVLVAGGFGQDDKPWSTAELYNPTTGTWTQTGSMNTSRYDYYNYPATMLPNGQVLVAGGDDYPVGFLSSAELYNPTTGTWTLAGSMTTNRMWHTTTLLPNGQVLISGGITGSPTSSGSAWTSSTELFYMPPQLSLVKSVRPAFSMLSPGTNYQLQVSADLTTWTNVGSAFTATNFNMVYPQYWDVDNWGDLFFRLQGSP